MSNLDRRTLSLFLPNREAIAAFEGMFKAVGTTLPATVEEANALAGQALAAAQVTLTMLSTFMEAIERLEGAPAAAPDIDPNDTALRPHLGTISTQNHDSVEITGGTINVDSGAAGTPSITLGGDTTTGLYRSAQDVLDVAIAGAQLVQMAAQLVTITGALNVSKPVTISVSTGTAPLVVSSTTTVANLHVEHATTADNLGTATTYPADATDLASCMTLTNALKAANIAKGV